MPDADTTAAPAPPVGNERPPFDDPEGEVKFTCNICGAKVLCPVSTIDREVPSCTECGSSVRFRSIVHLLSTSLFGESMPLTDFPIDRSIVGVGLSDAAVYAGPLAERVDYLNTYYHTDPYLDITAPPPELDAALDFMISSDVFEHVPPPAARAFDGAFRTLKPGGHLILTVPFGNQAATREHFPDLHDFEIYPFDGKQILVNRDHQGRFRVYDDLVFHGGDGTTLEMRVFCRGDLERLLEAAGFDKVVVFDQPVAEYGIFHRVDWSLPILARKPID